MIMTDCFAYFETSCTALNTLVCSKSSYCKFYKPESNNCNRKRIEKDIALYKGDIRYEKAHAEPSPLSKGD